MSLHSFLASNPAIPQEPHVLILFIFFLAKNLTQSASKKTMTKWAWMCMLHGRHSDPEQALFQLQPEQLTVSDAESGAACLTQVRGQEGASRVPCACTAPELSHVVITGACTVREKKKKHWGHYHSGSKVSSSLKMLDFAIQVFCAESESSSSSSFKLLPVKTHFLLWLSMLAVLRMHVNWTGLWLNVRRDVIYCVLVQNCEESALKISLGYHGVYLILES